MVLLAAAGLLAVLSEILVSAIEPFIDSFGLSAFFVGVVLIPTIGNLAEHLVSVQLAAKDKMEFAMAVTFGSSLQVALFVAPVLVLLGVVIGQPMDLVFTPLEIAAVAAAVAISTLIAHRRRVELARGRAADARLRDPRRVVLRVRLGGRAPRREDAAAREGTRAAAGEAGSRSGGDLVGVGSSSSSSSSADPGSKPARSGIGSSAGASPSADAWAASESAACCAS